VTDLWVRHIQRPLDKFLERLCWDTSFDRTRECTFDYEDDTAHHTLDFIDGASPILTPPSRRQGSSIDARHHTVTELFAACDELHGLSVPLPHDVANTLLDFARSPGWSAGAVDCADTTERVQRLVRLARRKRQGPALKGRLALVPAATGAVTISEPTGNLTLVSAPGPHRELPAQQPPV